MDVVCANSYWGKIVEHVPASGSEHNAKYDTEAYLKLAFEMQVYYQDRRNLVRHGITAEGVLKGDVCVVKVKKEFQRYFCC